jgi:hypothetical protein
MKRLIVALVSLCLCDFALAQELAQQGVPASVLRIYEKTEADLRRNREEYEKANEKTLAEFNKTVKKEADRLSKAGKPEEAVALKDSADAWFEQAMGGGEQGAVPQMPKSQDEKRKNPNGRVRLVEIKTASIQGTVKIEEQHENSRPFINGVPTTEQFVYTETPAKVAWEIPEGKKWFRAYAYYLHNAPPDANAIMEVQIDGKVVARTVPLSINNRMAPVVVKIPAGAKTLTLVSDKNGDHSWDWCVWVDPCFYDR